MARDLGILLDLEIKTQDYATDMETMKRYVIDTNKVSFISSIGNRDVGYALCAISSDSEEGTTVKRLGAIRLGVHKDFRHMRVSHSLMDEMFKKALQERCHSIIFSIPSYKIDNPSDPDYIGWWLKVMKFKASRVITDLYFRYGKQWDAYLFERLI